MTPILQVDNLSKSYKNTKVVNRFQLSMEKGHIHGLLGPNGAGKTTIMKMLAGLTTADEGKMAFFGKCDNLDEQRNRISFMRESPYMDESMTAVQNLEHFRYVRGVAKKERIQEVLEFVGLTDTGRKKVRHFSMGMRRRLGIAMALLPSPEIMILDEPVNGLDSEESVDVRNLLRKLRDEQGISILISSHLLSDLTGLCTDFTIIHHGEVMENLSAEELEKKCRSCVAIKTNDIARTVTVLEQRLGVTDYKVMAGEEIHLYEMLGQMEKVSKTITENGLIFTKLVMEGENLEEYYLSKVSDFN